MRLPVEEDGSSARDSIERTGGGLRDGFVRTAAIHEARGQRTEAAECYRRAADLQMKADPEYGHELAAHYCARASELDAGNGAPPPPHPPD